jgi:hypothetical protein
MNIKATALFCFFTSLSLGCSAEEDYSKMRNQEAVDSGFVEIRRDRESEVLKEITSLCKSYGLSELRNYELQKVTSKLDGRNVYILSCLSSANGYKDSGLFFSNSGGYKFGYQTFKEPFSDKKFGEFRSDLFEILKRESLK